MAEVVATYQAGYLGTVEVDAVAQPVQSVTFDDETDDWDAGNATTGGFAFPERGQRRGSGSFDMPLKVADDLPAFISGKVYPMEVYTMTGKGWTFNALINKKGTKMDQKGGTMMNCTFKTQGTITEVNPA